MKSERSSSLLKVRQIRYSDRDLALKKASFLNSSLDDKLKQLSQNNNRTAKDFEKAKELYTKIKINPQNYVGENKDDFKAVYESILISMDDAFSKKSDQEKRTWNPAMDSSKFISKVSKSLLFGF